MADRSVLVRLRADISNFNQQMLAASAGARAFSNELDTSNKRSVVLRQSIMAIAPAAAPIGAAAVPAIAGLTNQLAFAAAGAGVAVLAFSGVGEALKNVNDYAIEPTDANLRKMRVSMSELGPAGREFVTFLQEIRPELQGLQDAAQEGLFPGAQAGIDDLMSRLPQVESIVSQLAGAMGTLAAETGANLASPAWSDFFDFIENEARPTMLDFGRTLGNLAEGFANLWMAFDPLSDRFSDSFLQMSRDFTEWSDGLDATDGFQEFVEYITRVGPKVADTMGALGNALLQVVEAAAPVGEVMLPAIEGIADALAAVADSPAGPALIGAAVGISALSRAVGLMKMAGLTSLASTLGGKGSVFRAGAAGAGVLALSMTDLDEKIGLSNTAMGATVGMIAGPWGAAVGAGVGLVMDLTSKTDSAAEAVKGFTQAFADSKSIEDQAAIIANVKDQIADLRASSNFDDQMDASKLIEGLEPLEQQYADNVSAAQDLRFEQAGLGDSMADTSDAVRGQVDALLALVDAHNQAADAALISRNAARDYEAAIDDAAESVKKNGKSVDDTTEAGRSNLATLDQIAGAWNKLDAAGRNAKGGIGVARKEFENAAVAAGYGSEEAKRLAADLLNIVPPPPIPIRITGGAPAALIAIQAHMATLRMTAAVNLVVNTIRRTKEEKAGGGAVGDRLMRAVGGPVIGAGTGTSDSIPALLSNGEHVMTASEVMMLGGQGEAYRLRSAIRAGSLPAFATGGAVGSRYDDFSELEQSSKVELARQQQRIRQIEESLREKETVGKGKSKHKRLALRGLDRDVAELELRDAKAELVKMKRDNKKLKGYGTKEQEEAIRDREEETEAATKKAADDVIDEADRIAKDAADRYTSAKTSAGSLFEIGSSTSAAQVDRNLSKLLANSQTFLGLLGDLKAKGASPWLLGELVKAGPTGGAIKLAREYNSDQSKLDSVNVRAAQIDQYTSTYAGLVGNSQFTAPGAWNSGVSSSSTNIQIQALDVTRVSGEIARLVRHEISAQASGAGV